MRSLHRAESRLEAPEMLPEHRLVESPPKQNSARLQAGHDGLAARLAACRRGTGRSPVRGGTFGATGLHSIVPSRMPSGTVLYVPSRSGEPRGITFMRRCAIGATTLSSTRLCKPSAPNSSTRACYAFRCWVSCRRRMRGFLGPLVAANAGTGG